MKKHFKWLLGLVAGLLSAGSMSAADYNIVTYKYCALLPVPVFLIGED